MSPKQGVVLEMFDEKLDDILECLMSEDDILVLEVATKRIRFTNCCTYNYACYGG